MKPVLLIFLLCTFSLVGLSACGGGSSAGPNSEVSTSSKEELGEILFSDANLSLNRTQSCATCHNPDHAFIDSRVNAVFKSVSVGQDGVSFGDRNALTASYARFIPGFQLSGGKFSGGQFVDGRQPDLSGQAGQPPLNPVEMGMPDKESVVLRLQENEEYVLAFKSLFGDLIFEDVDKAYDAMTESVAAFERTEQFSPFDSKYDRSLRGYDGTNKYTLTTEEALGKALFFSETKTNCNACHQLREFEGALQETFSRYEYHNLGLPVNARVRTANGKGVSFIDHGLLDNPEISSRSEDGKFKISTLRNVAVTAPYMHNGLFQDLRTVILFYDKFNNDERVNNPETGLPWGLPEVDANLALKTEEFKAPALKDNEIDALIAFLKLLTDERYEHLIEP